MALGYNSRDFHTDALITPQKPKPHTVTVETINTGTANPSQDHYTGSGSYNGRIAAQGDATAQTKQAMRGFMDSRKHELQRVPGSGPGDLRKARGYTP